MAGQPQALKPILLRSSTPAPNEKVLKYLESMQRDEPEDTGPARTVYSDIDRPEINGRASPKLHSSVPNGNREGAMHPENLGNKNAEGDDDVASNTQDGRRTDAGDSVALPVREPGPNDPPGPRYESYDSGPSFGNFGPLPPDDVHYIPPPGHINSSNPFTNGGWQHDKPDIPWNPNVNPGYPAKVPLPESIASPRPASINIDVESPSSPTRSRSQAPSRLSHKAPSGAGDYVSTMPTSPRSHNYEPGKVVSNKGGDGDSRPLSPMSGRSKVTAQGTSYPPLPETILGEEEQTVMGGPSSPKARSRKTPSLSPSDSPSQYKPHRAKTPPQPPKSPTGSHRPVQSISGRSQGPGSVLSAGGVNHAPSYHPYRNAPTGEDLLHAAVRGRSMVIPEVDEHQSSVAPSHKEPSVVPSHHSKQPSVVSSGKSPSKLVPSKAASHISAGSAKQLSVMSQVSRVPSHHTEHREGSATPTPSRPHSPNELNQEEERIVREALASRTPRTSYYASSSLEPEGQVSHFHDMDLCVLLHQENDPNVHEVVKRAIRKAVRQRVKKLGMKYDNESIRQYRKAHHDHDPSVHLQTDYAEEPPKWASDLKREIVLMQQRIESLGPKIDGLRQSVPPRSADGSRYGLGYEGDEYSRSALTQTVNIHTQPTGTMVDSMYQAPETEIIVESQPPGSHHYDELDNATDRQHFLADGETHTRQSDHMSENRDDSPGQQYLEEELYKLRQKPVGSQSAPSHRSWEVARDDDPEDYDDEDGHSHPQEHGVSGLPTIPGSNGGRQSPPLPPIPAEGGRDMVHTPQQVWHPGDYSTEAQPLLPWQRIHQRLLNWAIVWPLSELDAALNSTTRGHQVDEVALSIWSTQTYKRYVRARLTDSPPGVVDRLFVPPNMADAISTAVFNGRHGDACGMLRDLWSPFGLEGMPRLLVVLAKHRSDENHWVVHRFSLPDGGLTTYDSYPERTLPDGRPLGWWFAIRVAWPNAIYPSPDHLMQKMVRLHRPMQLPIDNSVAAAGIWRNILMGSRAERSLDLERLRDLINTEVKNLRQRKLLGKLSIGAPRPAWEDMS